MMMKLMPSSHLACDGSKDPEPAHATLQVVLNGA